jgi:DNA (cytosine-5)-methyltransferase 1
MPKAVSLFSGCGGFCDGMELAGIDVAAAVEKDKYAAMTYRRNFPEVPLFEGDIADFLVSDPVSPTLGDGLKDVDAVFGGPPCQGFSQIGTRDPNDHRNALYLEYLRVVERLRPKICLMENVPNLLLLRKGYYKDQILRDFGRAGYRNACVVLVTASEHGVPQKRQRAVFIAIRDGLSLKYDLQGYADAVLASLGSTETVTVWQAISDLPENVVDSGATMDYPAQSNTPYQREMRLGEDGEVLSASHKASQGLRGEPIRLHNHHTKEMQARRRALISHLKPGHKADSLPKAFWDGLRPEKWRRLHPDWPSHTILAQMHRDLSEFVHPTLDRWITVREAGRLQSFHDGFVFEGSEWQQLKQIGNAVPPLLAYSLGRFTHELLTDLEGRSRRRRSTIDREVQGALPLLAG